MMFGHFSAVSVHASLVIMGVPTADLMLFGDAVKRVIAFEKLITNGMFFVFFSFLLFFALLWLFVLRNARNF